MDTKFPKDIINIIDSYWDRYNTSYNKKIVGKIITLGYTDWLQGHTQIDDTSRPWYFVRLL